MKRVVFTGHRDRWLHSQDLYWVHKEFPDTIWVHGDAIGFDTQVKGFALAHGIPHEPHAPNYALHGKIAPLVRNVEMLDLPDVIGCVACYDGRRYGGTFFTVTRSRGKGIRTVIFKPARSQNFLEREKKSCPACGNPLFYSEHFDQLACSDPKCVNAHGIQIK